MAVFESPALPAQAAAGADANVVVCTYEYSDGQGQGVGSVVATPPAGFATVTGVATNNATINVRQLRAGSVVSTFASVTLNAGTNLVAETPLAVPVSSVPALQANDVIDAVLHQNGTGIAVGAGVIVTVTVN
ncbi:MAG: hypothetical protein NVSMB4_03190 [Acidimicrobiales bacterium]